MIGLIIAISVMGTTAVGAIYYVGTNKLLRAYQPTHPKLKEIMPAGGLLFHLMDVTWPLRQMPQIWLPETTIANQTYF